MRLRYKSGLAFIGLLIVCCLLLGASYGVYQKYYTDKTVVVADGALTINYLNGNKFNTKKDTKITFSVTNNSTEEETFYIKLSNVYAGDATYSLKGTDNDLNVENNLVSSIVSDQVVIDANTTLEYEMDIANIKNENYSGEIVVALGSKETKTFGETIIANSTVNEEITTGFNASAIDNEGLIKTTTEDGDMYYFRGEALNNYVRFADQLWRIVKINEDGSVKLVLNNILDTSSSYQDGESLTFEDSLVNNALQDWYNVYLTSYTNVIASHKFCNDNLITEGSEYYAAYDRISKNYIPNSACLGESFIANVGLLTADEVVMAGASSEVNNNYYLYNPDIKSDYFTMTSARLINGSFYPFVVKTDGSIVSNIMSTQSIGVRPTINIIKNVSATGTGTIEDPYLLLDI